MLTGFRLLGVPTSDIHFTPYPLGLNVQATIPVEPEGQEEIDRATCR